MLYGQAGKAGLSFLKLGISARGVSMADAMAGHTSGAEATHYNPAGILHYADDKSAQLLVMHKEWIQDTRTEFLGGTVALDEVNAVGVSVNSTTVSDIEIRTRPGTPEGTFTARNFAFGASYARRISDELRLGLTAKFLFEKILIDEASGFALDLGAQYKTPVENLSVGATLANLGGLSALRNEKTTLPALLRIGPAYTALVEGISSTLTLAADVLHIFPESRSYVNAGAELLFDQMLAARVGYQFGSEGRGFCAGIGIRYTILELDYGYAPLASDLGTSHTFSLSLNL